MREIRVEISGFVCKEHSDETRLSALPTGWGLVKVTIDRDHRRKSRTRNLKMAKIVGHNSFASV